MDGSTQSLSQSQSLSYESLDARPQNATTGFKNHLTFESPNESPRDSRCSSSEEDYGSSNFCKVRVNGKTVNENSLKLNTF